MPRTAVPNPEQVPADSKPTLDAFSKNIGFTPNMLATFALSPIAFNSWATLLGSLSKALDVKTRDSIGLGPMIWRATRRSLFIAVEPEVPTRTMQQFPRDW